MVTFYQVKQHHATTMDQDGGRWINRHSLITFHHSLCILVLQDISDVVGHLLDDDEDFWCYFVQFFFLQKFIFSPLGEVGDLQNGIKKKKPKTYLTATETRCLIWCSHKLFLATGTNVREGAFLTCCAYLLAGICSHRCRLSSRSRVYCQRRKEMNLHV